MKIEGKIKRILETKEVGANNFKTREVDIVTDEQYPQILRVQFVQDKTALLEAFAPDQKVSIEINLKGREFAKDDGTINVFNTINGWKIEKVN